METEIIEKIKKQIIEIKKLDSDDRYFNLDGHVKIILNNLLELIKNSNDKEIKQRYELIWRTLDCRNDREVKFAKWAYDKARSKNAAKIREMEYRTKLLQTIELVESDLSHFIN